MISAYPNRPVLWCVATLVLVLCSMGLSAAAAGARKPATHTVTIDASRFEPELLTVKAGDTVVWVNKDIVAHTATSQAGTFDSGIIVPGKSWTYKLKQTGEFAYTCTYHPTMKATLRVN
jgi:plastocyanin